jgi:Sec-independent protein translocase protein TatA
MTVGVLEVLFVLFVVLLILGPRRIVDLGRALGRGVRDFKLEFGNRAGSDRRSAIGEDEEAGDGDRKPITPKASDKEL